MKDIFKKWWFWVIVLILLWVIINYLRKSKLSNITCTANKSSSYSLLKGRYVCSEIGSSNIILF